MTDEPQTERRKLENACNLLYRSVEGEATACAVVFAVEMLGPILLDIRDALQGLSTEGIREQLQNIEMSVRKG